MLFFEPESEVGIGFYKVIGKRAPAEAVIVYDNKTFDFMRSFFKPCFNLFATVGADTEKGRFIENFEPEL